jgi:hypothetical protein
MEEICHHSRGLNAESGWQVVSLDTNHPGNSLRRRTTTTTIENRIPRKQLLSYLVLKLHEAIAISAIKQSSSSASSFSAVEEICYHGRGLNGESGWQTDSHHYPRLNFSSGLVRGSGIDRKNIRHNGRLDPSQSLA